MNGSKIFENDILVGKTDCLHPMARDFAEYGNKERAVVKYMPLSKNYSWNGWGLASVAQNCLKVGTLIKNPELL